MPDFTIEAEYSRRGYRYIAGIDEAGRGSLAGPLSLGIVIYDSSIYSNMPADIFTSISDSKKISHKKRRSAIDIINRYALEACHTFVAHTVIDNSDINKATSKGVEKLIRKTGITPDLVIMDGNFNFEIGIPFVPVIKGDARSITISSASIIAKVTRDLLMDKLHARYPFYGFASNKGYGTRSHIDCIKRHGISPVHRLTYEPVKSLKDDIARLQVS